MVLSVFTCENGHKTDIVQGTPVIFPDSGKLVPCHCGALMVSAETNGEIWNPKILEDAFMDSFLD